MVFLAVITPATSPRTSSRPGWLIGVTRSYVGAQSLRAPGVEVYRGTLEEPETLRSGAENADGVIRCAFDHGA